MTLRERTAVLLRGAARRLDPPVQPPAVREPCGGAVGQRATRHQQRGRAELASSSAPGSRKASLFFDDHPTFYETSRTAANRGRLNLRYEAIFAENQDVFEGARVLDIASHDGRWSLAALENGAKSVVGIEGKPALAKHASIVLAEKGYGDDRAEFVVGDVHDLLNHEDFEADVVLCLGFLYHTLRYNELFAGIRRTGARHVIIDTQARGMSAPGPVVRLFEEQVGRQSSAVADRLSFEGRVLSGRPSLDAIRMMVDAYGYRVESLSDWGGLLRDNSELRGCGDYARQDRMTIRCVDASAEPPAFVEEDELESAWEE